MGKVPSHGHDASLPRSSQRTALAAALLALTGLATSCGGGDANVEPSAADPQSYYEDYPEGGADQGGAAGTSSSKAGRPATSAEDAGEPGLLEDNTFVDDGISGFVDPSIDPESTFALDVDNGSFRVAQALVAEGLRPPAESVRSEEWVNALPYDDPAPTESDLALRTETGMAPALDDGTQEVRVAVTARELAASDRPSVNLTLVVDRSGSMDIRTRLGLVKSSIALLAESLRPDDTVSVVAFDDTVELVLPPTRVDERGTILAAVDRLQPGGSTNLADGLRLGYEQARSEYRQGGVNVVVLCSDGVANVGMTGPEGITATIAEEGQRGIHLVTVGYGMGNYNDHLMEQLADQGDGFYRYVDTYEEATAPVRRRAHLAAHARRRRRPHPGGLRPGARDVVPPRRLRQPGDGRTSRSRTSRPTPASSAPVTARPRCTRCGSLRGSRPATRSARRACGGSPPPPGEPALPRRRCWPPTPR